MPTLSIVVPVYNEEATMAEFHRRLDSVLRALEVGYEVILVNDGSRDGTAAGIGELCTTGSNWRGIHLSRNFGQQAAVAAGLARTRGQCVIVMDGDLQDPPEVIPQLLDKWRAGYEVVFGRRARRQDEAWFKRLTAWIYHRLLHAVSPVEIPEDTGDFCLMDRKVVDGLVALPERNRYTRGLRAWLGFRQTDVRFDRPGRAAGETKYTPGRMLRLAADGILSFSDAPLRVATWLGLLVSAASFLLAIYFVILKLHNDIPIQGWASTVVIVLFLGGVQLLTIGVIGEYLGRVYDEVKQRPLYVVSALDNPASEERSPE